MKLTEFYEKYNWIKGGYAQDASGKWVDAVAENACSFCIAGAVFRMYPNDASRRHEILRLLLDYVRRRINRIWGSVTDWNDSGVKSKEEFISVLTGFEQEHPDVFA